MTLIRSDVPTPVRLALVVFGVFVVFSSTPTSRACARRSTRCTSATSGRRSPADASTMSRSTQGSRGAVCRRRDRRDLEDDEQGRDVEGRLRPTARQHVRRARDLRARLADHLGRHRRAEQPPELVVGTAASIARPTPARRGRTSACTTRARSGASCSIRTIRTSPTSPPSAICGRGNPERGVFKTTDAGRTWSKVLYVDPFTGATDLVMDPRDPEGAVRRDLSAPAQGVRLQRRRPGQRDLQDHRRRRDVEEARERHSRRATRDASASRSPRRSPTC